MSVLAIDWGEKRVGLALSEDGVLAFPFQVLETANQPQHQNLSGSVRGGRNGYANQRKIIKELEQIIKERRVEKIILGWPIGLSGNETQKTREVEVFYQELLTLNIPIEKVDERYSTKMVPQEGHGVDMKDAVSAQILLQEYLESENFKAQMTNDKSNPKFE